MDKNAYLYLLNVAWKYAKGQRLRYVLIYFLFLTANGFVALLPLLYGWFVDKLQSDSSEALRYALIYIGCYFALELIQWLCHGPARIMEQVLSFEISKKYFDELYKYLMQLPVSWHKHHHSGSTVNRLRKGYTALRSFFSNGFMYIHTFAQFVLSLIAMVFFSPIFGAVAVAIGLFTIWTILRFDRSYIKSLNELNELEHIVNAKVSDGLSKIFSVLTLRLEKAFKAELLSKLNNMLLPFKRTAVINEWKWFSAGMMITLIYCIMVAGYVSDNLTFRLGGLVALLGFVNQFTKVFYNVAAHYTQIVQYYADVQAAEYIQKSSVGFVRPKQTVMIDPEWREIQIKNLSFSYEYDNKTVLSKVKVPEVAFGDRLVDGAGIRSLRLSFTRGQKIALVGESGSGKSTIMSLIRGLYQPQQFELKVDGVLVTDWRAIGETVTLLPQQPELFENSILYNVTLGLPFPKEDVNEACRVAHVYDFVQCLPNGFETLISENGGNLSGGQRQRIALARGILAAGKSSIVLLDEPTSSVDAQLEIDIYKGLLKLFKTKLVLASFHNRLLMENFDYVYRFSEGRVEKEGPPKNVE